ncbi:hypothetical protein E2C01_064213 [Portunus trituberculatus]|uniref:Uncharacterized protein n=1 Tax=Portunus trituberculatus TaxID=210409 RepID=A0A5B7HCG4_PORTR|nr:hypothetical protein [Portunus trituberculatus]
MYPSTERGHQVPGRGLRLLHKLLLLPGGAGSLLRLVLPREKLDDFWLFVTLRMVRLGVALNTGLVC